MNVWALKISINVSENKTFGNRQFGLKPNNFVPISDVQKRPKIELFCLDFGQCLNTEPSGTGPKVERPRTECVRILDVDCNFIFESLFMSF